MKTCKKVSETRCSPHQGEMDSHCQLSDKNRCVIKKKSKEDINKFKQKKIEKKSCMKVSQTKCSPHTGKMDPDCQLSEKNRCVIIKKTKKNVTKSISKDKNTDGKKSCKKVSQTKCSPHTGKMDIDCQLSDKNRCVIIKKKKQNKKPSSSSSSTKKNTNINKYLKWSQEMREKKYIDNIKYSPNKKNIISLNPDSYVTIKYDIIPPESVSISSYIPYLEDEDFTDKNKFIKLKTCDKTCSNQGVFEMKEINTYLTYGNNKCPFCQEEYQLDSNIKNPPYGNMKIKPYKYNNITWYQITFSLKGGKNAEGNYYGENRYAYFPISEEGTLGLWLLIEAWKLGKLFNVGDSVTTGKKNVIIYRTIHMKSRPDGGLINHGYGKDPNKEMKEIVLPNLISECNANGIFIPEQLDDFQKQK